MIKLLDKRPHAMTKETWLEQRREAARELGRLKDKRAVPALLKIIAKERFDVVLEIAIDALGEIGDERAVPPLKKLLDDPSLDSYVRDAVAGALKKLGAKTEQSVVPPPPPPPVKPPPKPPEEKTEERDLAARLAKQPSPFGNLTVPELAVPADLIARADEWTIAAGAADVRWDGAAKQTEADLALSSHYKRQVERRSYGYSVDGSLGLGFHLDDRSDVDASWNLSQQLQINPEIRYYPFRRDVPLLCGQLSAGVGYGLALAEHPMFLDRRFTVGGNVSVGGGPAYGRIYNIGGRLRLRRVHQVLRNAGLLTGPLDRSIGDQIIYGWYTARNRLGSFTQLGYTLELLQRAGLLAKESTDPAVTYRLIRILDDPQLDDRPAGMLFRLGYGYARDLVADTNDRTMAFLYATSEYAYQREEHSIAARQRFFYEMYNDPDFYGLELEGAYTRYLYSANSDPLGSLSATLSTGLSNQPGAAFDDGGLAFRLLVGGSYSRYFTRGTRISAGLRAGLENRAPLVLFTLEAQHGIAAGSFASAD